MTSVADVSTPAWGAFGGRPRGRWLGFVFSAVWLVFLQEAWQTAWAVRDTTRGMLGLGALVAFAVLYLTSFPLVRAIRVRRREGRYPMVGLLLLSGLGLLSATACWAIGQPGTATFVFVAVSAVLWLPVRASIGITVGLALLHEVLVRTLVGWEEQPTLTFSLLTAAVAMLGFRMLIDRNAQLIRAREELAERAVQEERSRFARDLHDILGHTLTVVTVKAELAGRLLDVDPERARAEMADVERLSRDALSDVRRAVGGYRDLSLAAELARAREGLRSAGISDDLPSSIDDVPTDLRELFAWTIREGVTNVIRHSGATCCTVRVGPTGVRVEDDGGGPSATGGDGLGLVGLRERAMAAGAVVMTTATQPRGFRLEVLRG